MVKVMELKPVSWLMSVAREKRFVVRWTRRLANTGKASFGQSDNAHMFYYSPDPKKRRTRSSLLFDLNNGICIFPKLGATHLGITVSKAHELNFSLWKVAEDEGWCSFVCIDHL